MHNINNTRLNVFSGSSWVLVIMIILALGCGRFGCSPSGGIGDKIKNLTIPTIDPNEPIPAISSDAFDALIIDMPELAKYRDDILAAERDAIKGALDDLRSKAKAAKTKSAAVTPESSSFRIPASESLARTDVKDAKVTGVENDSWTYALFGAPFNLVTVAMAAEPEFAGFREFLIGHQIGFFKPDQDNSNIGSGSKTISLKDEKTGKVQATAILSIDTAGGPPTLELATATSMPVFGLEAGSKVSITGNACPDSDGKVDLTVKLVTNARSGKAGSLFYDKGIEARIRATVGDDANLIGSDIDRRQATHATTGGQQVDFITSVSTRVTGESYRSSKDSEVKVDRGSKWVSPADQQASEVGLKNAWFLAVGALESAKERWQGGGCIKIEATSPGKVSPSSTTAIPVVVRHKFDGSEVPSKLDAKLSGGKSVDPTTLAKTRGTLTYTAPGETGKSATIGLTATSRRGRATLDLTASTGGGSYRIVGGRKAWQTNTAVCDIMKPFTLTGGGFTMQVSGGLSGTYTYTGPFNAQGGEKYTISLPDGVGKPGTMTGGGVGCAGGKCRGDTEKYTLTPIEPCN